MSADLPSHLSERDVRAAANEARTFLEAQDLLRVSRTDARRLLRDRDLFDRVTTAGPESVGTIRNTGDES